MRRLHSWLASGLFLICFAPVTLAACSGNALAPPAPPQERFSAGKAEASGSRSPDFTNPGPCTQAQGNASHLPDNQCNPTPPPPPPPPGGPPGGGTGEEPPTCNRNNKGLPSNNGGPIGLSMQYHPPFGVHPEFVSLSFTGWTTGPYPANSLQYGWDVDFTSSAAVNAVNPSGTVDSYGLLESSSNGGAVFSGYATGPTVGTYWDGLIGNVEVYTNDYKTLVKTFTVKFPTVGC